MSTRVVFRDSRGREGVLEVTPEQTVSIGRGLDCAIRTDDGMVSRLHAEIRYEGSGWIIDDKGSANGTTVNQVRVSKQALHHRDIIQCGSLALRFLDEPAEASKAPPVPAVPAVPAVPVAPERAAGNSLPPPQARASGNSVPPPQERAAANSLPPSQARLPRLSATPPIEAVPVPPKVPVRAKRQTAQLASKDSMPPPVADARLPFGGPPPRVSGRIPSIVVEDGYERSAPVELELSSEATAALGHASVPNEVVLGQAASKSQQAHDALQDKFDREVADGKRLRAEIATLRDRNEELKSQLAHRDERIVAEQQIAEELRGDAEQAKAAAAAAKQSEHAVRETLESHERAAKRAVADLAAARAEFDGMRAQLADARRAKDEGYNEVNEQVREIERLRAVIGEQERMLEERRIALVTLEGTLQEQRADRDKQAAAFAKLRAEAAAASEQVSAAAHQIDQLTQENAKLSLLASELSRKRAEGTDRDDQGYGEIVARLSEELRGLRMAHGTLEQSHGALARELQMAQENAEAGGERERAAQTARNELEQRLVTATAEAQALQQELFVARASASGIDAEEVAELRRKLREALGRAEAAEASLLATPLAAGPRDGFGEESAATGVFGTEAVMAVIARVVEASENANDALSELRNHARVVVAELAEGSGSEVASESAQAIIETVETVKGALRELRQSVEESP